MAITVTGMAGTDMDMDTAIIADVSTTAATTMLAVMIMM